MKKHGIYIIENKKHQTKKIYNNGYLMATYLFQPHHIKFKNRMVNDMNQHFAGGWILNDLDLSDAALFKRIIKGKKPMAVIYGDEKEDLRKYVEVRVSGTYRQAFKILKNGKYYFAIAQKGKLKDLFDLKTLEEDYRNNGIEIDTDRVKNKTLKDYFMDWDAQDEDSQIAYWETGLILGYPIENTISLYKDGIR